MRAILLLGNIAGVFRYSPPSAIHNKQEAEDHRQQAAHGACPATGRWVCKDCRMSGAGGERSDLPILSPDYSSGCPS